MLGYGRTGRTDGERLVMKTLKKQLGEVVNEGRPKGSGTACNQVYEWRQQHPEGRKADRHRDTGLDPKTIRKWWDYGH